MEEQHIYPRKLTRPEASTLKKYDMAISPSQLATLPPGATPTKGVRRRRQHLRPEPELLPMDMVSSGRQREPLRKSEISEMGRAAAKANAGLEGVPGRGELPKREGKGSLWKGERFARGELVPDERAMMGEIPPASVTEVGRKM